MGVCYFVFIKTHNNTLNYFRFLCCKFATMVHCNFICISISSNNRICQNVTMVSVQQSNLISDWFVVDGNTSKATPTSKINDGASTSASISDMLRTAAELSREREPPPVVDIDTQTSDTLLRVRRMERLKLTDEQASTLRALRNAQEKLMRYRLHRTFLCKYHKAD